MEALLVAEQALHPPLMVLLIRLEAREQRAPARVSTSRGKLRELHVRALLRALGAGDDAGGHDGPAPLDRRDGLALRHPIDASE